MDAKTRTPEENSRGRTPAEAYEAVYDVEEGDEITVIVHAVSGGDIEDCDDRMEEWDVEVSEVSFDSRKNIHTVEGVARSEYASGTAYVRHHTNKSRATERGLAFGEDAHGSRMWLSAPVNVFEDDRDRTVVGVK